MPAEVRAAKGKICPLHQKDMSTVCHKCPWWTQLRGKNPNTGQPIDEWACAISFLPILLCESAQESRQTAAAVETFRNDMAKANEVTNNIMAQSIISAQNLLSGNIKLIDNGENNDGTSTS